MKNYYVKTKTEDDRHGWTSCRIFADYFKVNETEKFLYFYKKDIICGIVPIINLLEVYEEK